MKSTFFPVVLTALPVILAGCGGRGYLPGDVHAAAQRGELRLNAATALPSAWQVEPGIQLHRFTRGTGAPVLVVHGGPGIASNDPWPGLARLESTHTFHYYHQRGCGLSTRPIDRFTSRNFPQNVQTLVPRRPSLSMRF